MKIVHLITGLKQGGAESALFRLVSHSGSGFEHIVISLMNEGVYGSRFRERNIQVHTLDMPQGRFSVSAMYRLYRLLRRIQPDVVQTWMYHADLLGGIVARLAGYPVVWGIVNFNLNANSASFSTRVAAKLCAWLSSWLPDKIVTCSENAIESHKAFGYSVKRFATIHLGYDLSEFYFHEAASGHIRSRYNIGPGTIIFGCVARWDPVKDHRNLVTAFDLLSKEYSNVVCLLIGPSIDEHNQPLVAMIEETCGKQTNIILGGLADSVPEVMSGIDIHILSSLGEAFPNVVAEAMACQTPCIVTDVGDASIIVGDTGWVVPPADSDALYKGMRSAIEAMKNEESWQARRMAARQRILDNFSMQTMISKYGEVWKSVRRKD